MARIEMTPAGVVEARAGIYGFKLLRLGGSAFAGFVRDEYTTLPETNDRPLHMWLDLEWEGEGVAAAHVRGMVHEVFRSFVSGSIQQVIYQVGGKMLAEIPEIAEIHLEANNRTWDAVAEQGEQVGIYTEARPPFGCLGLRMKR